MTDNAPAPSPLDTLARLIDLYDGCARAGILSDLGRADRANLEALRASVNFEEYLQATYGTLTATERLVLEQARRRL